MRSRICPNVTASKVNIDIWNDNYLSLYRMADVNLRKMELVNLKATYATTLTCKKLARAFGEI